MVSFQLLVIHSENRVHIWEIFPVRWPMIMSFFLALTKLVMHEDVVSSTFTTTHLSYTRIPNGVIKMIIMQNNSSISSFISILDTQLHTHTHTFNLSMVKNAAHNVRGVCDPWKFFNTTVLNWSFLHKNFSIYSTSNLMSTVIHICSLSKNWKACDI